MLSSIIPPKTVLVVEHQLHPGLGQAEGPTTLWPAIRIWSQRTAREDLRHRFTEGGLVEPPAELLETLHPWLNCLLPVAGGNAAVVEHPIHPFAEATLTQKVPHDLSDRYQAGLPVFLEQGKLFL